MRSLPSAGSFPNGALPISTLYMVGNLTKWLYDLEYKYTASAKMLIVSPFIDNYMKRNVQILLHFIGWMIFIQIVFEFRQVYERLMILSEGKTELDEALIFLPLLVGLFYVNAEWLIPKFLNKKGWWKYLLLLLAALAIMQLLASLAYHSLIDAGFSFELDAIDIIDDLFFLSFLTLGLSCSYAFSKIAIQNVRMKKIAEKLRLEAELKYLKSQVNPHFLFNSLNTIYSLANEEESPQTTEAVLKLSEMMRYMLHRATKSTVALQSEIDFLHNFIELQLLRLADNAHVDFHIKGKSEGQKIAPLLLIAFVENVFKHGVSYENSAPIFIELTIEKASVTLMTKNTINKRKHSKPSGFGIENAKKRLKHIYPNKHELQITENEETFEVELVVMI